MPGKKKSSGKQATSSTSNSQSSSSTSGTTHNSSNYTSFLDMSQTPGAGPATGGMPQPPTAMSTTVLTPTGNQFSGFRQGGAYSNDGSPSGRSPAQSGASSPGLLGVTNRYTLNSRGQISYPATPLASSGVNSHHSSPSHGWRGAQGPANPDSAVRTPPQVPATQSAGRGGTPQASNPTTPLSVGSPRSNRSPPANPAGGNVAASPPAGRYPGFGEAFPGNPRHPRTTSNPPRPSEIQYSLYPRPNSTGKGPAPRQ